LHAFGDREAIRNPTLALHHLREGVVTEELIRAHAGGPAQADFEVCNREAAVKTVKLIQTFPVSACERMAVCYAERSDGRPSS
jgi:hypothetical protein